MVAVIAKKFEVATFAKKCWWQGLPKTLGGNDCQKTLL